VGLDGFIDDLKILGFTDAIDNAGKIDAIKLYQNYNTFQEDNKVKKGEKGQPNDPYMNYLKEKMLASIHVEDLENRDITTVKPTPLPEEAYCDNWISSNGLKMLKDFPEE